MKKWIWISALILIAAGLYYFIKPDNTAENKDEIKTALIKRDDLRLTVAATGVVTPYVEVEVKSKAGGGIISFPYEEGDSMEKGEVAVRLDPEIEQSRVNQANADLLVAEARLEKAKINLRDAELRLKRQQSLFNDRVISKQDLDNAVIEYEKARSDVKIAEAELVRAGENLKEARDRLQDTEITAPLTGTILKKFVEEGQVIASTLSSASEGTQLFTMADLNRIYVVAMVDETDIGKVRPGQETTVSVDAYRDKYFNASVLRIAPKGRVESTITVFDVTIEVADKDKSLLKPMMTANVEILTDLENDVLIVPSEAVRLKEDRTGIYIMEKGAPVWTQVRTGKSNGIMTEIQGNVKEGEKVVLSGLESVINLNNSENTRRGFRLFRRKK